MHIKNSSGYNNVLACSRGIVVLFFLAITFSLQAQVSVPVMNHYVGDQGKFLDQESELVLNDLLEKYHKETGYGIYVVSVPSGFCDYSEEDAKVILESITAQKTDKSMLLYVCDKNGYPAFQYYHGEGWSGKLDNTFFINLNANVIRPYTQRYMTGNGMIIAVKLIMEVQVDNANIDFEELNKSLSEAPTDVRELSQTDSARFGKSDSEDLSVRIFIFILFTIILGIGFMYSVRTRGMAGWFLFIFMLPFWLVFYSVVIGDEGWMMSILYVAGFFGGRIMVKNNNWWFQHRTVLRNSGAFAPPPPMITETRRRISRKKFEGNGSRGSWEQDYE